VNLTIAQAGQTITFGPTPSATYTPGGGLVLSASASSGLPVSYSRLTMAVCTAGSGTVHMVSAGNCTIAADQAGNANYSAAPQVTQGISIAKAQPAPLTLLLSPANIGAVGGIGTLSTSGGAGTGAISFATTPSCSIAGATLTGNSAGTCTVTATQVADANYPGTSSNPVNVQVGVGAQATLFLNATSTSLSVNGTSALSTTGGSGGGTVTYAVSSGTCTVSGATLHTSAAGQCQVVATKAGDGTFGAATSDPVTVSVRLLTPSALVLSASQSSIGFGGNGTLGTSGGIAGGTITYTVSGPCYVVGSTLTGTSAGTCQITATQAATNAYSAASSNTVMVTVKERTTTFSYPAATAMPGSPFTLTPTTAGFVNPTFALLYGSLPVWATLNPTTGVISGTPTGSVGTFDFVVTVRENNDYDAALAMITVQAAAAPIPTLNEWGMIILSGLLAVLAFMRMRRMYGTPARTTK